MPTCAFTACSEVTDCPLVGGCLKLRTDLYPGTGTDELPKSKALNGTKPRASRDPRFIKRARKALR